MDQDRIGEALERNTRAFEDLIVAIREFRLSQDRNGRVLERLAAEIVDQRAETRAQTRAVLKVLDRWGDGPAAAGA